jgi:SHS2 domain-containing protein
MALVELTSDALSRITVAGEAAVAFEGGPTEGRVGLAAVPGDLTPVREVKAVTYHRPVLVERPDGLWMAEVTVDL